MYTFTKFRRIIGNFAFPNRKMAASKQQESKEEDFNYKTKYKAYKRRLKLLVYVSATGVELVTVLEYLNLNRFTFDFVQEQEYFKSLLEKIEQSLIVVERDKRCGVCYAGCTTVMSRNCTMGNAMYTVVDLGTCIV